MQALIQGIQEIEAQSQEIGWEFGMNSEVNAKCGQGHKLHVHRGVIRAQIEVPRQIVYQNAMRQIPVNISCSLCEKQYLESAKFFYRCHDCAQFNICRHCAYIQSKPPVLQSEHKFWFHACPLKRHLATNSGNWDCDGKDLPNETCLSNLSGYYQAQMVQGYECRACNFDICLDCVLHHMRHPPQ